MLWRCTSMCLPLSLVACARGSNQMVNQVLVFFRCSSKLFLEHFGRLFHREVTLWWRPAVRWSLLSRFLSRVIMCPLIWITKDFIRPCNLNEFLFGFLSFG